MTRATFQAAFEQLLAAHHPALPEGLGPEIEVGVAQMIEAAVRSAGEGGLRPEVVYAIRASKLAARLLPAEVYREPTRRAQIKASIRALVRSHLTPPSTES